MKQCYALTYERTEYGKAIRKQYENHEIQLARNQIRRRTIRKDGISNTITTVLKDFYILEIKNENRK